MLTIEQHKCERHNCERFKVSKVKYALKDSGWLNEFVSMWLRCKSNRWVDNEDRGIREKRDAKILFILFQFFLQRHVGLGEW